MSRTALTAALVATLVASRAAEAANDCARAYERAQERRIEGKLGAARVELRSCIRASCASFIRHDCLQWLDEVETLMPTVLLLGRLNGREADGISVRRDDDPRPLPIDGRALPVDPGQHRFTFEAPGARPVRVDVQLEEGQKNHLVEANLVTAPGPQMAKADPAPVAQPPLEPLNDDDPLAQAGEPASQEEAPPVMKAPQAPAPRVEAPAPRVETPAPKLAAATTPARPAGQGLAASTLAEPAPPVVSPFPEVEPASWSARHRTSIILASLGAVGLGVFGVAALDGLHQERSLAASCAPWCRGDDVARVRDRYLMADVGLGIGVVSLALATYSFIREVTAAPSRSPIVSWSIGPRGDRALLVVSSRY
jgi:hypothetical protein